jgi:glycosyltransferase involved in cell wall biosynthesis
MSNENKVIHKDKWPRITIVTPSYNQGKYIERTILSVINQNYPNLEYFIIDGGSTDNTIDIIKKYEDKIDWWVSEKDRGQADALNKGFKRATGDFLTWINSDDILLPGVLKTVAKFVLENPKVKWIAGNVIWIDEEDRIIHCSRLPKYNLFLAKIGFLVVGGPSTFFHRSLYQNVEGLRIELSYNMDTDLWWQFESKGEHYYRIPEYFMAFRFHEGSKTSIASFKTWRIETKPKLSFILFRKPQYEKRQKEERDLLFKRYGKRMSLYKLARLIHCCHQILNGNYLKAWSDLKKYYGKKWQEVFPLIKNNEL